MGPLIETYTDGLVTHSVRAGYRRVVEAFDGELGACDRNTWESLISRRASWGDVKRLTDAISGPHGLVKFLSLDQGSLTSLSGAVKHCTLLLVGNPVLASSVLDVDIRAGLEVPLKVCIFDKGEENRSYITYDLPSARLGNLNKELEQIGELLDAKLAAVIHRVISLVEGASPVGAG